MRASIVFGAIIAAIQILDCHGASQNSRLNFFDIDLLRYCAENKKGNVVVSPASIKSTLAMVLEGAAGPTAVEIKTALRVSPVKEDYREELHLYLKALEVNSSTTILQNANALFYSKKLKLMKNYQNMIRRVYFSEIAELDFNDPWTSADVINGWVSRKTHGLIPTIIEEVHVTPTTEMLITNALYFKAPWKHGFDVDSTHSDCFYNNGICRNVAMMDLQAELNYAFVGNLRAHALELPYMDDRYSMILLVPQDRDAAVALVRDLPYVGLPHIADQMEPTEVILTLPKFTVDYSDNMVGALRNMRITSLFSQSANLSGIFEAGDSPHLNSIFHSVHMTVDEVGTVAAGASVGMVVPLINNEVQLRVDRPFLFFIRDNNQGMVLFEGKIEEPTEFVATNPKKGKSQPAKSQSVPLKDLSSQTSQVKPTPNQPKLNIDQTNPIERGNNQELSNQPSTQATRKFPCQMNHHQLSETAPVQNSYPSGSLASEDTESPPLKKSGGVVGWFRRLGGYF